MFTEGDLVCTCAVNKAWRRHSPYSLLTSAHAPLQKVISSLEYNHAFGYLSNISQDRPYSAIMRTTKDILKDALPIKVIPGVQQRSFTTVAATTP